MTQIAGLRRYSSGMVGKTSDREGASHVPSQYDFTGHERRTKNKQVSQVLYSLAFLCVGSYFSSTNKVRLFYNTINNLAAEVLGSLHYIRTLRRVEGFSQTVRFGN